MRLIYKKYSISLILTWFLYGLLLILAIVLHILGFTALYSVIY